MTADTGVAIRPARPDDLDALLALDRATGFAPHWPLSAYAEMLQSSDRPRHYTAVAEEPSKCLIGFAVVAVLDDASAEIESVVVAAGARRRGIGRALCAELLSWCRWGFIPQVQLEVRSASTPALSLYTALGFAEVARRFRYYREPEDDAILMRLPLR